MSAHAFEATDRRAPLDCLIIGGGPAGLTAAPGRENSGVPPLVLTVDRVHELFAILGLDSEKDGSIFAFIRSSPSLD